MKIGVISDTHIPDKAKEIPREIFDEFMKVDMVIHAGDLVEMGVLNQLKEVCGDVRAVSGNMDPDSVRTHLPDKLIFKAGNYKIAVMHGTGSPEGLVRLLTDTFRNDSPDIIIFGHSHNAFNEKIKGVLFFNPGSATDKIFVEFNSYGIIEINGKIEARIIKL